MHRVSMEKVRNEVDRWLTHDEEERLMAVSSAWLRDIAMARRGFRQEHLSGDEKQKRYAPDYPY